jgi:hypothetical protein
MTVKARKCKGCKALPTNGKSGVCAMGRSFVTTGDDLVPLAPCCPDKAITREALNYKLSLL